MILLYHLNKLNTLGNLLDLSELYSKLTLLLFLFNLKTWTGKPNRISVETSSSGLFIQNSNNVRKVAEFYRSLISNVSRITTITLEVPHLPKTLRSLTFNFRIIVYVLLPLQKFAWVHEWFPIENTLEDIKIRGYESNSAFKRGFKRILKL